MHATDRQIDKQTAAASQPHAASLEPGVCDVFFLMRREDMETLDLSGIGKGSKLEGSSSHPQNLDAINRPDGPD
jgi:hypothetical protein